jgi:hypothetical protein
VIFSLSTALLIAVMSGYFLAGVSTTLQENRYLRAGLGVGLGFGISSCLYVLRLLWFGNSLSALILIDLCALLILYALSRHRRTDLRSSGPSNGTVSPRSIWLSRLAAAGLLMSLVCALILFLRIAKWMPQGGWDAWAVWNMKARFLFRGGTYWKDAFSVLLPPGVHPEYPLLVPGCVARCWEYVGTDMQTAPIMVAFLFTFATVGLLVSSVAALRGALQGMLAGLVLLSSRLFLPLGAAQYADIPIGFFFLASLALVCLQEAHPADRSLSFLAGMAAACASFTKNEGALFVAAAAPLIIVAAHSGRSRLNMRHAVLFMCGMLTIVPLAGYVKFNLAPPPDLFLGRRWAEVVEKLTTMTRYDRVSHSYLTTAKDFFAVGLPLVLYPVYLGMGIDRDRRAGIIISIAALIIMAGGFFFVYVISPYDLSWHLETSLPRLFMQLWPSFVLTYFLIVRAPHLKDEGRVTDAL